MSLPSPTYFFKQRWGRSDSFRPYTFAQRHKLLCLTVASGSIPNLEVVLANAGLEETKAIEAAAEAGQLDVCKMLRERGCPWGYSLRKAAGAGHRHVCEWLLASGCPFKAAAVSAAAHGGHEGLMHWLITQLGNPIDRGADFGWQVSLLLAAAAGLHLEAFQRLLHPFLEGQQQDGAEAAQQQGQQQQPREVLSYQQRGRILAAAAGSPTPDWQAKVEWLEGLGYPRFNWVCSLAAGCSPDEEAVRRLKWFHSRGYSLQEDALGEAASHGNLATLRFLMEQVGVLPLRYESLGAARRGDMAMLQYLHASGIPMKAQWVAVAAAQGGHLPVVTWAVEALGATPGSANDLLDSAAISGSVELMTWLLERGWAWGEEAIYNAVRGGCEEAVEWLVEQGCPWPVDGEAYTRAATNGDLAMIRCLHRLGCPWGPPEILAACVRDAAPVAALRCLVELGCPVDWVVAVKEAEACNPGEYGTMLLSWLCEERLRRSIGSQQ